MKKLFTQAILGAMATLLATPAAAYDFQSGNIYYNVTGEHTVAVTYATEDYASYAGNVTLPGKVTHEGTNYQVTAIGDKAFYASTAVSNVRIPASVLAIGSEAFVGCSNMTTVYMEDVATLQANSFDFANVTLYVPELMKDGFLEEAYYNQFKDIIETDEFDVPIGSQTFVISEIFFTGTTTPEGKQYTDDQYFKIANNSDEVQYLDGYAIAETAFLSTDKQDYTPDLMNEAVSVGAIYAFPGSGQDYPVQPGQEVVVALNAINHLAYNPNSFDLLDADFEVYDESENPNIQDPDNPAVTNLANWYDYSASYWTMHNRGFKSYVLAKPEVDMQTYVNDYYYTYTYVFTFGEYSFDMDGDAYKLPNAWVVDGVGLSVASSWEWNVLSPTIDSGWAHCGTTGNDKTRYNKSVIRKKDGNKWVDTNNSTEDFISEAPASMLGHISVGIGQVETEGSQKAAMQSKSLKVYRLDGQRVSGAKRSGLYIMDGKKVMVK